MNDRKQQVEQLIKKLHSLKRLMNPDAQCTGEEFLAPSQWLALFLISRHEGIGIKELASKLGISSSAATQLVDGLVDKGMLLRQPALEDRRALRLSLPKESRKKIEALKVQRLERFCAVFSSLDDEEFRTLIGLLDKVVTHSPTN
ncbi:MarR family winged helix-turn-helix transcriptional regulator [Dehalogenimonas etheniformans]|uniref:MarR family transcriptional regulator n=1 Tax=Dehalogenimonas etheniformans TaxID=1536648 RepID=A0A2P5P573_9CHLR|nr:MarR family transcriptional regulator [Dehalogenimonas etheniformans]PPD57440.1 MarR family transcriptional regulator [Dehalogenimonas etheniformans]QNT76806.1 MarR family transcriptional regulator [Dehalogenimonas etheniformans]